MVDFGVGIACRWFVVVFCLFVVLCFVLLSCVWVGLEWLVLYAACLALCLTVGGVLVFCGCRFSLLACVLICWYFFVGVFVL